MIKINCYSLFSLFVNWAKNNNWIQEVKGDYFLTPEGQEELVALGLDLEQLNGAPKEEEKEKQVKEELCNGKQEITHIHLYTDGGSRGNQYAIGGKAAIGIVVCDDHDEEVTTHKQYLGRATNNQAEYTALITGLNLVKNYHPKEVTCISDSQLMINQLNGLYKIKDKILQKHVIKVKELEKEFQLVKYVHQPRENRILKRADKLVNQVLDAQGV